MIGWIVVVTVAALLSYLSDVGVLAILGEPVPFFGGSSISVILMIACIMMLLRATRMSKKGEKELLREQIEDLKQQLEDSKRAPSQSTGISP